MLRKLSVFSQRKFRDIFKNLIKKNDVLLLKDKDFVIISDNCWGGSVYQWYKKTYNSPFVGLYIYGDCYLKLLSNLDYYIKQDIVFINKSKYPDVQLNYPLGKLGDIEIHFMHYKDEEEVLTKWKRRTKRMLEETNLDNYFFKIDDREGVTKEHLIAFHKLPFKNKISFSKISYQELENENQIKIQESDKKNKMWVPNGEKLFKITFIYFDLNKWLLN